MWRPRPVVFLLPAVAAQYSLIIDAGSSGSRIRIFNASSQGVTRIRPAEADAVAFETEPGLSSFAGSPAGAGPSLAALLRAAQAYVPLELQSQTPLWVKATAGMRLVPERDSVAIVSAVRDYLDDPQNCPFQLMSISVLAGEEEAAFAYLALNSMLGSPRDAGAYVGVLDMGGASMQVAYKPSGDVLDGEFSAYVAEQRESFYARSFLQFGMDAALQRAQLQLAGSAGPLAAAVAFPCFNRGFSEEILVEGRVVNVTGTSDSAACEELTRKLLHTDYECMLPPCPFMGVHMPRLTGAERFFAMSNFFYVCNALGLLAWDEAKTLQPQQIALATSRFCSQNIHVLMATTAIPMKYLRKFCFGGHYVGHVLRAYGFEGNSTAITFARRLHGQAVDWTLGAALYETLDMPLHRPAVEVAPPCEAAESSHTRKHLRREDDGVGEMSGPRIFGAPEWILWLGGLAGASALGWLVNRMPSHLCCASKFGQELLPTDMPMSPVGLLGSPPDLFRAVSAPALAHSPLGRKGSRRVLLG